MKPTLINYSRVSTARQEHGTGLAQQQNIDIMNVLSEMYQLPIDDRTFIDVGRSAFKGSHLEHNLGKLIELINVGDITTGSILVVSSLDRLSRQHLTKAVSLLLNIISQGIGIHTTIDNRLYTNDSDSLMADLMMSLIAFAVANEESLKKSKRSIGAVNAHVERHLEGFRTPTNRHRWIGVGRKPVWVSVDEFTLINT